MRTEAVWFLVLWMAGWINSRQLEDGCTEWRNQTAVTGCGCGGFD